MAGKYIHRDNCKAEKKSPHREGEMKGGKGAYKVPEMNRKQSDKQVVKGEKHYRKA